VVTAASARGADEAHLRANLVRALAALEERSVDAVLAEMAEGRADAA
jgi:hypothetical protein